MESEDVLANAVSFLIDGREFDAAHLLLACSELAFNVTREHGFEGVDLGAVLTGPRALYDAVDAWAAYPQLVEEERRDLENGMRWESPPEPALTHGAVDGIKRALQACTPPNQDVVYLSALVEGPGAYEGWRREMAEAATQVIHNQAVNAERVVTWANLRFRSQSEVRIAKALSNSDVMFLPNCRARLPLGDHGMGNREPDFLVCADGKWGILEVDGEPWHPASRAAQDHERDRLFRRQGVRIIERYAASRCYDRPDEVVDEFLNLLRSL